MQNQKGSYTNGDLIEHANGRLFGEGYGRLPLPPMLMVDRIATITKDGGTYGNGYIEGHFDIDPELWFFKCHFKDDPVMPGCLGLDAMWQLVGFFLGWLDNKGNGRALGVGEVKFRGMVLPEAKVVSYHINMKRVINRRLIFGVGDGVVKVDGAPIYEAKGMRVGLFESGGEFPE